MKLLELGNTRWKLASLDNDSVEFIGHGQGLDDLLLVLSQSQTQALVFASVASDALNADLQQRLTQQGIAFIQVRTQREFGQVVNSYHHYQRLGVDRWLTLLAAHQDYPGHSAIIDVGTAVTFDLLHADGRHLGGWIAPGLHLMQDALVAKSTRLQARDDAPPMPLGHCTEDAVFLGCRAAVQGFIGEAHAYVVEHFTERVNWIFTGGGLAHLDISLANAEMRPHLVLEGLAVVARTTD